MPLYKAFDLYIHSEVPLPELVPAEKVPRARTPDIRILRSPVAFPALGSTLIHRRGVMAQSAAGADEAIYLRWEGVAGYKATGGTTLHVDAYTEDPAVLSLFTVSEALGGVLLQRGLLLLHASSVQVGDSAYCFLGEPGAGKSTTASAFVKHGAALLSDDLTAIAFDQHKKPFVLPAYPQLKIWENTVNGLDFDKTQLTPVAEGINKYALLPNLNFPAQPVPLAKIFLLHDSPELPVSQRVSPVDAPVELVRHFPLAAHLLRGRVHQRHFQQCSWCAGSAEIWHKRRPSGFGALEKWAGAATLAAE